MSTWPGHLRRLSIGSAACDGNGDPQSRGTTAGLMDDDGGAVAEV